MFGGMHLENVSFKILGDWLDRSGWTIALTQAEVATPGVADSFIHASYLTRTRRTHQVKAASLYILLSKAYCSYLEGRDSNSEALSFSEWTDAMCKEHPQFLYWYRVQSLELSVLQLVRSFRVGDFNLYRESLINFVPCVFAMDHVNYARWLPVHIRDMYSLETRHPEVYQQFSKGAFVVHKTQRVFSAIALDQAHEQVNALVKGDGVAVGLTENPAAPRRWMVAGPKISRII